MEAYTEWGYLGALIFLVMSFGGFLLKMNASNQAYHEKRDAEWRSFFTTLNSTNKDDICALAETMERISRNLTDHDNQAKVILNIISEVDKRTGKIEGDITNAVTVMKERTQPLPRRSSKGAAD